MAPIAFSAGQVQKLESLGTTVKFIEIESVDDFEGEIGRSFEITRRISTAVKDAVSKNSLP
jgi:arginase